VIIGVTASRTWQDEEKIRLAFDLAAADFRDPACPDILIEGGAGGGDVLCRREASRRGWHVATMKALWAIYGMPAGHIRNNAMIYLGMNADCWLAFIDQCRRDECQGKVPHDSHGAGKGAERAQRAGIEVRRYGWRY